MIVKTNTPWEQHIIDNPFLPLRTIWVKREDLCCPPPGPSFSKIRGLEETLLELTKTLFAAPSHIGVLDTSHSKAGWGVSYLCQQYGLKCSVYYPKYVYETEVRPLQKRCRELGAEIIPLQATKSAILFHQAKKDFLNRHPFGHFLPNGLKLPTTVASTAREVFVTTPDELIQPSAVWVVSVSSGTIAAGVAMGLTKLNFKGRLILHLGYSRSHRGLRHYLKKIAQDRISGFTIDIIDEKYEYKDRVTQVCPFPCNPYYDLKAWKWLVGTPDLWNLHRPVVFWNIGS